MKNYLLIILIFAAAGFQTKLLAQKKPIRVVPPKKVFVISKVDEPIAPPPAKPAEYVDASEFSNGSFNSKDGNFKIAFTALPKKYTSEINAAFGKTVTTRYEQISNLMNYGVLFLDFPTVIKDQTELRIRYNGVKEKLISVFNGHLVDEKDIFFGDYFGKEYSIETDNLTITLRLFLIEQRFFQISTIAKGANSKLPESARKFSSDKTKRFFDSFSITQLPKAKTVAIELPKDFGIKIDNAIFTTDFFNFTMPLPQNWNLMQNDEANYLKEVGKQNLMNQMPNQKDELNLSNRNSEILLMMTKVSLDKGINDALFGVVAEKVSFPNFLPEAVIIPFTKDAKALNETISVALESAYFGGEKFAWCETSENVTGLKKRFYVANIKGIAFEIIVAYRSETDLNLVLDLLKQSRFTTKVAN